MPVTTATVTGDLNALVGELKDARLTVKHSGGEGWHDAINNTSTYGGGEIPLAADGTFSIPLPVTTGTAVRYMFNLDYVDPATRQRKHENTGWVELTANTTYAVLAQNSTTAVPPSLGDVLAGDIAALDTRVDNLEAATPGTGGGGGGTGTGINPANIGYDIVFIAGQSNAAGYSGPVLTDVYDITHPRIWQYAVSGTHAGNIILGKEPLTGPTDASMTPAVGPLSEFARQYARILPENRRVLVVMCAVGSSGLIGERWDPASADLFDQTVDYVNAAVAKAGANSSVKAIIWQHGEHDSMNGVFATQAEYAAAVDELAELWRAQIATAEDAAFIVGPPPPEWVEAPNGTSLEVRAALADTPNRLWHSYYAPGPSGMVAGDGIHYTAAGAREMGKRLFEAWAGAPAPAPDPDDVTPPVAGTLAASAINDTGLTLTVTGASDETALAAAPYSFSTNNGSTWSAYGASASYVATGLTPSTEYTCRHRVKDAAGNVTLGTAITATTDTPSTFSDTFTRADASTLGATEVGALTWTYPVGTWGIASNKARINPPVDQGAAVIDVGSPNHRVGGRVSGGIAVGVSYPGWWARLTTTDSAYFVLFTSATDWGVYRRVMPSEAATLVKSGTCPSGALVEASFVESGGATVINVYVNGVASGSAVNDSTADRPMGTKVGLRNGGSDGTDLRWDDFTAQAL